jgi:four helix bundle protein
MLTHPDPDPDPVPDPDLPSGSGSDLFDHDRLDVYRVALSFVATAHELAGSIAIHSGSGYLVDQLRRAASSIVLNIAEGAGEYRPVDKARFYRIALRSATECAAIFDVAHAVGCVGGDDCHVAKGRNSLARIVAMLTKMSTRTPRNRIRREDRERDRDRDRRR